MKTRWQFLILALGILSLLTAQLPAARAQGTAFTYQGRLNAGGQPANGLYDIAFTLFGTNAGGVAIAGPVTNSATAVSNGLFTTTIDFGPGAFTGVSNWLEIAVSTGGANSFSTLSPRQPLTPTPYALVAQSLPGLTVQPNTNGAPNVVGGSPVNFVAGGVLGGTVAGGGAISSGNFSYPVSNSVTADFGTVSGGAQNIAGGYGATVGGGVGCTATANGATVGGGYGAHASGSYATAAGGYYIFASGNESAIGGGEYNQASGFGSTVAGGVGGIASGDFSAVLGGDFNNATNTYATVAGGYNNLAGGQNSFAAGQRAQAVNDGAFVWADLQPGNFYSQTSNSFNVRATGGVFLVTSNAGLTIDGPVTAQGVQLTSDRNAKENFRPLDAEGVLARVAALPVSEWNYKTDPAQEKHIGPMAQDFHAAFGLNGGDDRHISVIDEGGVALTAIQGLNQKLETESKAADSEIQALKAQNELLAQRLAELEATVKSLKKK